MSLGGLCNVASNNSSNAEIMVSVSMLVYNHERWVAKAIESVLMQETNFRYELIIAEDCSTDNSRNIIEKYAKSYPNIIRAYYNPVNLGMDLNDQQNDARVRGKYYAILEGDDYWTDPHKLQIQVDFLENNPEYSGCYHSVKVVDENDEPFDAECRGGVFNTDSDVDKENWPECPMPGQAGTVVMRNLLPRLSPELLHAYYSPKCNGDVPLPILMLRYGKIRRIGRVMSCYRRTYTGDSYHARMVGKDLRFIDYFQYMERDRLAALFWQQSFLPHYDCMLLLQGILDDMETGKLGGGEKLIRMAVYDIGQFLAFMAVFDYRRIAEGEAPRLYRKQELIDNMFMGECILFGTGDFGERIYNLLIKGGSKIKEVWDNNSGRKKFHDIAVVKPHLDVEDQLIILASKDYEKEMSSQLNKMGYTQGEDYITYRQLRQKRYILTLYHKIFRSW